MTRCKWTALIVAGTIFLAAAITRADDTEDFARGAWTFTSYGSYVKSFTGQEARLGSASVGAGYYFLDRTSFNVEFAGYYNSQPGGDARLASGDFLLRTHLFESGRFSLFIDGLAGISYADHRTPATGTFYNYIVEPGVGMTLRLWDDTYLIGGARYFHLSNARLEGPLRNPSINATQAYVGMMFKF